MYSERVWGVGAWGTVKAVRLVLQDLSSRTAPQRPDWRLTALGIFLLEYPALPWRSSEEAWPTASWVWWWSLLTVSRVGAGVASWRADLQGGGGRGGRGGGD